MMATLKIILIVAKKMQFGVHKKTFLKPFGTHVAKETNMHWNTIENVLLILKNSFILPFVQKKKKKTVQLH